MGLFDEAYAEIASLLEGRKKRGEAGEYPVSRHGWPEEKSLVMKADTAVELGSPGSSSLMMVLWTSPGRLGGERRRGREEVIVLFARHLGGVHLELTGDNVTECTGGARNLSEEDLSRAYRSTVDPRLNAEQALEVALLVARRRARHRARR